VTIARAISNDPKILLLDEPTGDLDTRSTDIVMKILVDLNVKKKITMVMVTHDQGLRSFANRVVKMSDGKIFKIQNTDATSRDQIIKELDQRIINMNNGKGTDALTIRVGTERIEDGGNNGEMRHGRDALPDNYAFLKDFATSKTSVRKPRDYPVLRPRFTA